MLADTTATSSGTPPIFSTDDRNTSARVGAGSWAPMSWNIFAKIGTMNSSMPMTARIAITKTTTG